MADRFRIKGLIGVGGFGRVYLAEHLILNTDVALKTLHPDDNPALPDLAERFKREAALARKLNHPNIVKVYEFGEAEEGLLYLSMEYIDGIELADALKSSGTFALDRSTNIMSQILDALAEAHAKGVVHRDLKPSNVMLTKAGLRDDVVKLLDFGIAKAFDGTYDDLTAQNLSEGIGFGTPHYMAPEQITGEEIGPHTDIYAAGLLWHEMCVGYPVMYNADHMVTIHKQMMDKVPIPDWLGDSPAGPIFTKALKKKWSDRYEGAQEMYAAIQDRLISPGAMNLGNLHAPKSEVLHTPDDDTDFHGAGDATMVTDNSQEFLGDGPATVVVDNQPSGPVDGAPTLMVDHRAAIGPVAPAPQQIVIGGQPPLMQYATPPTPHLANRPAQHGQQEIPTVLFVLIGAVVLLSLILVLVLV